MASAGSLIASITLGGMDVVEKQLRKFSKSMQTASKNISKVGDSMRDAGESIKQAGDTLAPLSAGLVAVGGAALVASNNIESATNNFKTKLGAVGEELEGYESIMNEVASTGVGSFDEVSNAIVTLKQNMKGVSNDELAMLTEEAIQLANVMDSDVGEVTKVANQIMTQFGENGATAFDLIAKGYQNGMDYAGDYLDTINEYSVYFKTLGFEAEDMFNILISGAEAGAFNLDKVGDAVKEFNIRAKDGSKDTISGFEALGFNAEKMMTTFAKGGDDAKKAYTDVVTALAGVEDQTVRNGIGVQLFGTQYEDMEKDVIASTASVVDHMKNVEGASMEVAQNNKTFGQEMQGYWNEIQTAIKPVGDTLKDFISQVMPPLVEGIKKLSTGFQGMSPNMQKVVLAFGAFVAFLPVLLVGVGGFLSLLGSMTAGVGTLVKGWGLLGGAGAKLISGFKKIGTAFKLLSRLFLTNPFMLIVTGIIIVAVLIYKYWDEIVAVTKAVWEGIKSFFSELWEGIKQIVAIAIDGIKAYFDFVATFWKAVWDKCVTILQAVWEVIKTVLLIAVGILVTLFAPIYNGFVVVWNAVVDFLKVVVEWIKAAISVLVNWIQSAWQKVKAFTSKVWNAIYNAVIKPVIDKIKSIVTTLVKTATDVMNKVKSFFKSAWDAIYNAIVKPVIDKVKSIIDSIKTKVSDIIAKVKSVFSEGFNSVKTTVSQKIEDVKSKITGIWDKTKEITGKIKDAFSNIFTKIKIPSFSLGGWTVKDLPKLPKMSVQWNAKGGILDSATMIGAGEKGAEAIVPLSSQRRMKPFAQAVSKFMPESSRSGGETNIHVAQLVVREEADIEKVAKALNKLQSRKERARGGMSFNG